MNRLANEPSLYLRQHAANPVDWYPWGDEAWARAKAEDKPVLVSIGYSACHWCHVMAHECFEDEYIAGMMNQHFICIKVDREERPDVDQIYMEAVRMITQHGGWPLNAFCLPDGRPFFGGTYFPPTDTGRGIIPWPQLLMRVADFYARKRSELAENAENIVKNLQHANVGPDGPAWDNALLVEAARGACSLHDDARGGFGGAPKFPPAMTLDFLLAVRGSASASRVRGLTERIDSVTMATSKAMARGGIFDQFGGGFYRYSVDAEWSIPHFEKMLYDNALLLDAYAKAFRRYNDPLYAATVEETVGWLTREMVHPEGPFSAALDADSGGHEGATYVWTRAQVSEVLGETDARAIWAAYGISEGGNFEHGSSNPAFVDGDFEKRKVLAPLCAKLLEARKKRLQPGLDSKILLSWNALLIRGLAEAAWALNRRDWFAVACRAADWLWDNLRSGGDESRPHFHTVFYASGGAKGSAFLDDYAFFAEALLALAAYAEWAEPGSGYTAQCIARAKAIAESVRAHFRDPDALGYFFTADDHEALAVRKKEWWDNAIPSGNAALAHVFAMLHALTGEVWYAEELARLKSAYSGLLLRAPTGVARALAAFTWDAIGVAVLKVKGSCDWEALRNALATRPYRPLFLMSTNDPAQPEGMQLCVGTQCATPTTNIAEVAEML